LLTKFHGDSAYVALVMEDAKLKRRWAPDPLCPHDASKNRYWITDVEEFSFKEGLHTTTNLTSEFTVTSDQAAALTADGGPMSSLGGQLGVAGLSDMSIGNISMEFFGAPGGGFDGPASRAPKGGGKGRKGKGRQALPPVPPATPPPSTGLAPPTPAPVGAHGKTPPHIHAFDLQVNHTCHVRLPIAFDGLCFSLGENLLFTALVPTKAIELSAPSIGRWRGMGGGTGSEYSRPVESRRT
jgi:hypothetical protein